MKYTVGVITYNRPQCVRTVLRSLVGQVRLPDEVVVVDDSESDATEAVVRSLARDDVGFDVYYESGDPSSAQPGARNTVIERASGDVVCFVDDDVYCEPMWLDTIHETYVTRDDVAGVGGPAILTDEDLEPQYDWYVTSPEDQNRINRFAEDVELAEFWIPPRPVDTDFLLGANMTFRTSALETVGGFDTDYRWGPAYYEETDVMAKFGDCEDSLVYHPDAMVCHVQSTSGGSRANDDSTNGTSPHWFSHNHINVYWFAHNHVIFAYKHSSSFPRSLLRLLLKTEYRPSPLWEHVLYGLKTGDMDDVTSLLAGYRDGLYCLWESRS